MQQDQAIAYYLEYGRIQGDSAGNLSIQFTYSFPRLSKLLTAVTIVTEQVQSVSFWYKGYSVILKYHKEQWYMLPVILEGRSDSALVLVTEEQIFQTLRDIDHRQLRSKTIEPKQTAKQKTTRKRKATSVVPDKNHLL